MGILVPKDSCNGESNWFLSGFGDYCCVCVCVLLSQCPCKHFVYIGNLIQGFLFHSRTQPSFGSSLPVCVGESMLVVVVWFPWFMAEHIWDVYSNRVYKHLLLLFFFPFLLFVVVSGLSWAVVITAIIDKNHCLRWMAWFVVVVATPSLPPPPGTQPASHHLPCMCVCLRLIHILKRPVPIHGLSNSQSSVCCGLSPNTEHIYRVVSKFGSVVFLALIRLLRIRYCGVISYCYWAQQKLLCKKLF